MRRITQLSGGAQTLHVNPRFPDGRKIDDPSITSAELEWWIEKLEHDGSAPHYLELLRDCLNRQRARGRENLRRHE